MKKRMTSALALMMTMTMVFGSALTVHAAYDPDVDDGCYHGDGGVSWGDVYGNGEPDIVTVYIDGYGPSDSDSSSDSGSSSSSDSGSSYSEPSYSYDSGSSDSGSSDSGSTDSGSHDNGSSDSSASYSAPAVPKAAGNTTGVTGKETFRALAKAGQGSYKVTHKGVEIATFSLVDAEGKSIPCTAVALKQRTDGKWAIDFQVTESNAETTKAADTTGLTVGAPLDRTYMYKTLGVSYVTINDTVVIDIEAEAQAAAEAAKATATK